MKIGKQNNSNEGNVYNIENVNSVPNNRYLDISSHLVEESLLSSRALRKRDSESALVLLVGALGFLADISELFPGFDLPWWAWTIVLVVGVLYFTAKFGDTFGVSLSKNIQVIDGGKLILRTEDCFSVNRSEASCIYPNCPGVVYPIVPPEKYDGPYKIMGKCSSVGLQHGYVIDDNLQAYPMDIFNEFVQEHSTNKT